MKTKLVSHVFLNKFWISIGFKTKA